MRVISLGLEAENIEQRRSNIRPAVLGQRRDQLPQVLLRIPLNLGTRSDDLGTGSGTPGRSEIGA